MSELYQQVRQFFHRQQERGVYGSLSCVHRLDQTPSCVERAEAFFVKVSSLNPGTDRDAIRSEMILELKLEIDRLRDGLQNVLSIVYRPDIELDSSSYSELHLRAIGYAQKALSGV